jgi:hypothetical protein
MMCAETCKQVVVICFEILPYYIPGTIEERQENLSL